MHLRGRRQQQSGRRQRLGVAALWHCACCETPRGDATQCRRRCGDIQILAEEELKETACEASGSQLTFNWAFSRPEEAKSLSKCRLLVQSFSGLFLSTSPYERIHTPWAFAMLNGEADPSRKALMNEQWNRFAARICSHTKWTSSGTKHRQRRIKISKKIQAQGRENYLCARQVVNVLEVHLCPALIKHVQQLVG